ncbi:chorismate synthase [Candidatus Vidania fulgoroideae]|uniref:Chorismate synthase n=1 Tax=Candidatus Vidania fulgoroideorum TaxID=881286 RepID=A0A975AEA7_9PROT|nr:chorismate synthase [Candidatus Vidania fulgoroideae]
MTSFGESHGNAVGCIIDGCPAGFRLSVMQIQAFLDRRRPGKNKYVTSRQEPDKVHILSGLFLGRTTGTPICVVVYNYNTVSSDYNNLTYAFRPGHADLSYFYKYGLRDHRGGGRSSARATIALVIAGAIARAILACFYNVRIYSYVTSIATDELDFLNQAHQSQSQFCFPNVFSNFFIKNCILAGTQNCDSVGATIKLFITNLFPGLGDPLYSKLDAELVSALMSVNAVKCVFLGNGNIANAIGGVLNNDAITSTGFLSNNAGGVLGGVSTGQDIVLTAVVKPTPSVFVPQRTISSAFKDIVLSIAGRHDPCVGLRAPVIIESLAAIIIFNFILRQRAYCYI